MPSAASPASLSLFTIHLSRLHYEMSLATLASAGCPDLVACCQCCQSLPPSSSLPLSFLLARRNAFQVGVATSRSRSRKKRVLRFFPSYFIRLGATAAFDLRHTRRQRPNKRQQSKIRITCVCPSLCVYVCATRVDVAQSLCIFYEHAHIMYVPCVCVLCVCVLFVACLRAPLTLLSASWASTCSWTGCRSPLHKFSMRQAATPL